MIFEVGKTYYTASFNGRLGLPRFDRWICQKVGRKYLVFRTTSTYTNNKKITFEKMESEQFISKEEYDNLWDLQKAFKEIRSISVYNLELKWPVDTVVLQELKDNLLALKQTLDKLKGDKP